MRLVDYLDKGASLDADAPCLTTDGESRTYAEVQDTSRRVAIALARRGVRPGDKVAILSANDPTAFTCVFGISRAAAVWCPVNPRNEAAENRELLDLFDCSALLFAAAFAPLVDKIRGDLPAIHTLVCLDDDLDWALSWDDFLGADEPADGAPARRRRRHDRRHRRHDRAAQGRHAHPHQPRDDDGAHPDGLPVRGPAGLPRAGAR